MEQKTSEKLAATLQKIASIEVMNYGIASLIIQEISDAIKSSQQMETKINELEEELSNLKKPKK